MKTYFWSLTLPAVGLLGLLLFAHSELCFGFDGSLDRDADSRSLKIRMPDPVPEPKSGLDEIVPQFAQEEIAAFEEKLIAHERPRAVNSKPSRE